MRVHQRTTTIYSSQAGRHNLIHQQPIAADHLQQASTVGWNWPGGQGGAVRTSRPGHLSIVPKLAVLSIRPGPSSPFTTFQIGVAPSVVSRSAMMCRRRRCRESENAVPVDETLQRNPLRHRGHRYGHRSCSELAALEAAGTGRRVAKNTEQKHRRMVEAAGVELGRSSDHRKH